MKYGYIKKLAFKSYGGEPTNWQEHRGKWGAELCAT